MEHSTNTQMEEGGCFDLFDFNTFLKLKVSDS